MLCFIKLLAATGSIALLADCLQQFAFTAPIEQISRYFLPWISAALAQGEFALSPLAMALPFAGGQALLAVVIGRRHHDPA